MRVELATKSAKTPVQDAVRQIVVEQIIPLLLKEDSKEYFYPGNGENLTLGQDSFFCNLTNDDGSSAGRLMFAWSPNIWGPKVKSDKDKASKGPSDDRITLTSKEIALLDNAIGVMKANNDFDNAVKLATIKSVATANGGKVSRDDFRIVATLQ